MQALSHVISIVWIINKVEYVGKGLLLFLNIVLLILSIREKLQKRK